MSLTAVIVDSRGVDAMIVDAHIKHLPSDTILEIIRPNISSIKEYNELLVSIEFWQQFKTENILVFQSDSMLLRQGIEAFYEYDYVGASWNFYPYVGNGGLSFRHKSAMIKIIENKKYNGENEDVYFSLGCKELGLNLAPINIANTFSCETQYHLGTLGYHAIDKWLTNQQCNQIKKQYD
jgi:hypothetical protein